MTRPQNVGIKAIEIYFPNRYVPQPDLEKYMHVSAGKHTIGLGQTNMSFCDDREDINSLALTALSALLHKNTIPPASIGYLGVGTESLLDRSKSTKTVLMQLFTPENPDIEGVDSYNACYGGTAALLAAVAWIESSAWDGRDAVVVCGDIAAYAREDAAARPTGGAGCVAMLVGADAPVVVEAGVPRASYMRHAWDFFKADFGREAAVVDGAGSGRCYLEAVDGCYRGWVEKMLALEEEEEAEGKEDEAGRARGAVGVGIDAFDYFLFHAPNCKLVAKAYARLLWNDLLRTGGVPEELRPRGAGLDDASTLGDKGLEKQLMALAQSRFEERVRPALLVPAQCGNMYTASLYSGLVGLLASVPSGRLQGKRIGMFSYGSGLASTLFTLVVRGDTTVMAERLDLHRRLAARVPAAPEVWDEMCRLRERAFQRREYVPRGDVGDLLPGTYYLEYVDELLRRRYAVKA
ncbi:hydroxymethylglutaryl-CoA synthase [Aspergillus brunneoviolaceus CBS 621.78]|uniref:Hydroxymethylglutaryl-CoA synthase n=1 Tax=Aspergillus brunneoviolaceus CBS 621.78 TaxID=1450534 RepID=A0ACD1G5F3_9EURO|nr:hydroxymethylglutaryl-CoA synthase [Aspergillus brunneoviolaceus CBS 621.78]RAH44519.1 hydroxymethylglutaryl-CoA synthase [Aspergillus brunneoviolaceus CBS 621.78]